jgi:DNA-binding NtrC family response regulator
VGAGVSSLPAEWRIQRPRSVEEAVCCPVAGACDAVVLGWPAETACGGVEHAIEALLAAQPGVPLVVFDPQARPSDAARYVRLGASDVGGSGDDLVHLIHSAALPALCRRRGESEEPWRRMLVGSSPAILRAVEIIRLVAQRKSTVLITGETGTGKEVLARALHMASARASLPMVTVNIAALPGSLLEAELFGHVKGAFTGAVQHRVGRFEQAHRSTLLLDEIGDLPMDLQTKLLRFLQERELQRVGSSETLCVDVRLIAATHANLAERVREGRFREDLFYRLNVVPMAAPPLRERVEDIPLLAEHFVRKICRQEDLPPRRLTPEALARLQRHPWPGNVRQLENAVETAVALSGEREALYASDFTAVLGSSRRVAPLEAVQPGGLIPLPDSGLDFDLTVQSIERHILEEALRKTGGNKTAAAEMLGLKRTTLSAKLRSLAASAGAGAASP